MGQTSNPKPSQHSIGQPPFRLPAIPPSMMGDDGGIQLLPANQDIAIGIDTAVRLDFSLKQILHSGIVFG